MKDCFLVSDPPTRADNLEDSEESLPPERIISESTLAILREGMKAVIDGVGRFNGTARDLQKIPLAEFASFSNALAPLVYWVTFNTQPNIEAYEAYGWSPGPDGITPEFLLDVSVSLLEPHGLPIQPVGQGASGDMEAWTRFLDHASQLGMEDGSVWRHGVTEPGVWALLQERSPAGQTYVVQPGDTLVALARRWGVTVESIAQANQIADSSLIQVGQVLCIPSA